MSWLRVRFEAYFDDPKPVKFPPPGPYWVTGFDANFSYSTVVTYVKDLGQVKAFWPEAQNILYTEEQSIKYSDRFPRPEWWKEGEK